MRNQVVKIDNPLNKPRINIDWLTLYTIGVICFLFVPVLLIILFSFHSTPSLSFPFKGFSLRWYVEAFNQSDLIPALKNSLMVASVTAISSAVLGILAGFGITRIHSRISRIIGVVANIPIMLPGLFLGIALLGYFSYLKVHLSLVTVILAHIIYTLPYFVLVMVARLDQFDISLEEASQDLGATIWQTFRLVTFPLIGPSIIGGALLVFALSFDEFLITFFVIGSQSTLPMVIWSMLRHTINPSVNAIATLTITFSLFLILVGNRLTDLRSTIAGRKV
jgi:spermidine/putrescine transport system permease protein